MIGGIVITKRGPTPGVLAKQRNQVQRGCFSKIGHHWHRQHLPEHFKNSAFSRYPGVYKPRKGQRGNEHKRGFWRSYTGRKLKTKGHTLPLVYTGESRRLAMIRDVRATSKGNRVVIHARKFNFKNRHSQINMREEATVINDAEGKELIGVFDREFDRLVGRIQTRTETKVV